jgi:Pentapeptide repeats (8 copies)
MPAADERTELRADCARCAGLCCVATGFAASSDFAIDKPAGRACPNLRSDFGCGIHDHLRARGFAGCAAFDCFGAGQHVVQVRFGGRDWRQDKALAQQMFVAFDAIRLLNELLWYLAEARSLVAGGELRDEVEAADTETHRLVGTVTVAETDLAGHRVAVGALLDRISEQVRSGVRRRAPDRIRQDLIAANLRGADLTGVSLRGSRLIGADLRRANLRRSDLLGVDLRGADLRGAQLAESLFLTEPQLAAAVGDGRTTIPTFVRRPRHWPAQAATVTRRNASAGTDAGP